MIDMSGLYSHKDYEELWKECKDDLVVGGSRIMKMSILERWLNIIRCPILMKSLLDVVSGELYRVRRYHRQRGYIQY